MDAICTVGSRSSLERPAASGRRVVEAFAQAGATVAAADLPGSSQCEQAVGDGREA